MARNVGFGIPSGKGIIEKRGESSRIRFFIGRDESGKKHYSPSITVRGTDFEVAEQARQYRRMLEINAGSYPNKVTVREFLPRWLALRHKDPNVKQSTFDREKGDIERLDHYFGHMVIDEIKVSMIIDALDLAAADGVSAGNIHNLREKLRMLLEYAWAEELISSNPARNAIVKAPRPKSKPRRSLTEKQAAELLYCSYSRNEKSQVIGVMIALMTACRRGEVLGLQWKHIAFGDNPEITIEQQLVKKQRGYENPKADSSGTIPIDKATADMLANWKREQAEWLKSTVDLRRCEKERRDAAEAKRIENARAKLDKKIRDAEASENAMEAQFLRQKLKETIQHPYDFVETQTEETAVVTDSLGEAYNPDNYGTWFRKFCCKNGLGFLCDENGNELPEQQYNDRGFPVDANGKPYSRSNPKPKTHYEGLKFHELRHTAITLAIDFGGDTKTVQKRARHATPSMTFHYAHGSTESDRRLSVVYRNRLDKAHDES